MTNWIVSNPPVEPQNVLVTLKDLNDHTRHVVLCRWDYLIDMDTAEIIGGPTFTYDGTQDFNDGEDYKVLAWMPQPEPYKEPFKVIVAGSRKFDDYKFLKEKLDKIFGKSKPAAIVCGEAQGADKLGRRYAEENKIPVDSHPANWEKYGKQAGYLRNEEMTNHAQALVAFWDGKSSGTKHMIETAKRRKLQVRVIRFDKK